MIRNKNFLSDDVIKRNCVHIVVPEEIYDIFAKQSKTTDASIASIFNHFLMSAKYEDFKTAVDEQEDFTGTFDIASGFDNQKFKKLLKYANISKNKGKCKSFLFKEDMPYYVPQMFVFPILTTARHILKIDKNGGLIWKMNPYTFLEIVGPNATMTLLKGMSEYKDRHKYMKLPETWRNVYSAARDAYNDSREED